MQLQVGKLPIKPEELHRMHLPWQKEEGENKLCLWGLDFKSSGGQEVEFSEGARVSRATMFFYKRYFWQHYSYLQHYPLDWSGFNKLFLQAFFNST